jgi:hypothetical protein
VIYARSDIQSVTVSDAHGGCGSPHLRPEGEACWGLSCAQCEGHLRTDSNWSTRRDSIPETVDEVLVRENAEKNAGRSQVRAIEAAAGLIALLSGPRDLLAGAPLAIAGPAQCCRRCDAALTPGMKFCGECGAPALTEVA